MSSKKKRRDREPNRRKGDQAKECEEQEAGSTIIESLQTLFLYAAQKEKRQEREMRTEMGKMVKSVQQCESFSIANLKRKYLLNYKQPQCEMGWKKRNKWQERSLSCH
eukprot:2447507-Ditylum_brightwellii.AAC.1